MESSASVGSGRSARGRCLHGNQPASAHRSVSPGRRVGRARRIRWRARVEAATARARRRTSTAARPRHLSSVHEMEIVELGSSGLRASRVGLGCNNFGGRIDLDATRAVVEAALEVGITFFDTAEVVRKRRRQRALPGRDPRGATRAGRARDEVRRGPRRVTARETTHTAIEGSLERLRTNYLDLYYLHKPDPSTPSRRHSARSTSSCVTAGARDRVLELLRRAARGGRSSGTRAGNCALHRSPEPLQPARARR